ncbi:MAG: serine hydrolase domain-containing protein [Gaiellaceae bacterium]
MPTDPCKPIRDQIAQVQTQIDELDVGPGPTGKPGPGAAKLAALKAKLANLESQLHACTCRQAVQITGTPVAALSGMEDAIRGWMCTYGVHALEVAVARGGTALYSCGFASGGPRVQPSMLFRLASCSKAFTCAAITALYAAGSLKPGDHAFSLLGFNAPSPLDTITVDQLVHHAGGWVDRSGTLKDQHGNTVMGSGFDPVFAIRQIGAPLQNPPTKHDIVKFMLGQPLQFKPGKLDESSHDSNGDMITYSNFGYLLLGMVVEQVSGRPYVDYVRDLLAADGIADVHLARMLAGPVTGQEPTYEDAGSWGPSALEPHANVDAPRPYGGGGFVTELMDSGGGLMATAAELARFAGKHAAWGTGGRAGGSAREGQMSGTTSWMESRPSNDLDIGWVVNQALPTQGVDDLNAIVQMRVDAAASALDAIKTRPAPHAFVGRVPRIEPVPAVTPAQPVHV